VWDSQWDSSLKTVPPEAVVDASIEAYKTYPNKRLIIHFMQPHYPFIGTTGRQISQSGLLDDSETNRIWDKLRHREVSRDVVLRAYEENLEVVLPHIHELIDSLDGKSVVTSDHGNAFGRFGVFGHPHRTFIEDLVVVPWLEIDGNRRDICLGDLRDEESASDANIIRDRLSHLGYLE
jgi:hypothetical protein